MWYTLPWAFDEFFHEYTPYKWIITTQVFEGPSQKIRTINQSSIRTLDASAPSLASPLSSLPHIVLPDCIETLHLSYYNEPIRIPFSALRHITLANSINCLDCHSLFPATVRSIRILLFYTYPNYVPPKWPMVLYSLSTLLQLRSLRIFMYDMPVATIDNKSCQLIAKAALLFNDFGFCFRRKFNSADRDELTIHFKDHIKFIKQLRDCILLFFDKQPYYSIEKDKCGLIMWF
jgi:hypothetical protein